MYSKQKDKFSFQQQYPFYTTCNPNTLKFSARMLSESAASSKGTTPIPIIVPVKSACPDEEYYEIPEVGHNTIPKKLTSVSSSYWSFTFGGTIFPFLLWGCPIHTLLMNQPTIRTTGAWLKCLFSCPAVVLTFFLLIFTLTVNTYFFYLFSRLFNNLFIAGVYEESMFRDLIGFLRDIPVIIPLNYVWLRGFKINNIISLLNQKYRMFSQISCAGYRVRLFAMMIGIACIHIIRYFSYKKYAFKDLTFWTIWNTIWEFSVDIFVTLTFPVYCTFCYAVRYELSTIKALVYEMIRNREPPRICHLSKFKMLFTHAADHVISINDFFSIYLSLTIVITIVGTFVDAENLVGSISSIFISIFSSLFGGSAIAEVTGQIGEILNDTMPNFNRINDTFSKILPGLKEKGLGNHHDSDSNNQSANRTNGSTENSLDPVVVRQVNADIACIVLVYAIIFFTIWQAVVTNDWTREVHVWLNDFVSGAGGTDVKGTLMELGIVSEDDDVKSVFDQFEDLHDDHGGGEKLIWARNRKTEEGLNDELLEKFHMLKAYIHVRLQLEKPALLSVALVGLFLPSLSGRLKRYHVLY